MSNRVRLLRALISAIQAAALCGLEAAVSAVLRLGRRLQILAHAFGCLRRPDFEYLAKASASAETMLARLPTLEADEDEVLFRDAGFSDVTPFYSAFSFRGWVAMA